ncbi:MATE family efflux transporter [Blautia sp. HCP3S3_H10_1]|uniref:MATE family efflux transporter n=1 Tax=unclassified Blautia TaxID=2648079 RepID=UPI003F90C51D|nr:MATE family efflux transporter [Clostridia bacterium]
MKNKQLNLTSGPILRTLAELALPIMASSFLSTAYNITDMAWIGMLGSKAVAGVGVGGMYVWLSQGFSSLARMGGQVNMAQSLGKGDRKSAAGFAQVALQLTIFFALLVTVISLVFTNPLLQFFTLTDPETYDSARIYMRITCGLILFSFLSQVLTGLFTAQGDSKTPLKANFFGLVLNMILDPLLVLGVGPFPRLEVVGAAVATVTAQIIVLLVLVTGIIHDHGESNVLRKIRLLSKPDFIYVKQVFRIGIPTALQGSIYCIISMVLTRMVSGFGAGAIAVQRVGGQIESLSWNTADGFGSALNAFMGQNYGAGKTDRIKKGYNISLKLLVCWTTLITIAFVFFPRPISVLFFHEEEVVRLSIDYLRIIGFSEILLSVEMMTVGALSGLGRTQLCSVISITLTVMRIPLALILSGTALGLNGIWWALTLSSVSKGIIFYVVFQYICRHSLVPNINK